jgi:transposase
MSDQTCPQCDQPVTEQALGWTCSTCHLTYQRPVVVDNQIRQIHCKRCAEAQQPAGQLLVGVGSGGMLFCQCVTCRGIVVGINLPHKEWTILWQELAREPDDG